MNFLRSIACYIVSVFQVSLLNRGLKDVRVILKGCNYAHQPIDDRMLRDMIVFNIDDELLREKLMHKGSELTLDRCIEICRTLLN